MKKLLTAIAAFFRGEWEKMRPLTFREKLIYIWDYYRVQIFLTVFLIVAAVSLITTIARNKAGGEIAFGIGIVNDLNGNDQVTDYLASGFGEYLGLIPGEQKVSASSNYTVSSGVGEYEEIASLLVIIDAGAGAVDAVICEEDVILYFSAQDSTAWRDLRTILDETALDALSDRLYYAEDGSGGRFPCGISLRDTRLTEETSLFLENPYLVFASAAKHTDYMDDFVAWITEEGAR